MVSTSRPRKPRTSAFRPLEKDIQKQIMEWLAYQPLFFGWRQNAGMSIGKYTNKQGQTSSHAFRASSMDGISDIIGSWGGRPLAIEVKRPGEKPRPNQIEFLANARAAGWITLVVTSLDELILGLKSEK